MNEYEKQFKNALDQALKPLLVGLRADIKRLQEIVKKAELETKEVHITNPEPKIKKVEVQNTIDNTRELEALKDTFDKRLYLLDSSMINLSSFMKSWMLGLQKFLNWYERDAALTKEVKVNNQTKLPKIQKVREENPVVPPDSIFIKNFKPSEAIPVILTRRDRKAFYELITMFTSGSGGGIPSEVIALLKKIDKNTDQLELKTDTVNLNVDEVEQLLKDIKILLGAVGGTFQESAEITTNSTTETDVVSFTVPTGKIGCLTNVTIDGDADGLFRAKIDGVTKWFGSIDQFQSSFHASMGAEAAADKIIKVTVVSKNSSSNKYRATISGKVS